MRNYIKSEEISWGEIVFGIRGNKFIWAMITCVATCIRKNVFGCAAIRSPTGA
jgi:hypothetical protein